MKFLLASFFLVFAFVVAQVAGDANWEEYKKNHGKNYDSDTEPIRAQIFAKADARIKKHNSNPSRTFDQEHNKFSDMTDAEKLAFIGATAPPFRPIVPFKRFLESLDFSSDDRQIVTPQDFRNHSCMPPVKNQLSCGSCWAFSAITPLEFAHCRKNLIGIKQNVTLLSEQQLVDCDTTNGGCNGGWYTTTWKYLQNVAKGSAKQSLYPYTAVKSTCKFNSTTMTGAKVLSYGSVSPNAATMMAALTKYYTLSVAIYVTPPFYSYKSGVFIDPNANNNATCNQKDALNKPTYSVNHGVVVVGWGTTTATATQKATDYWVVRNSWGPFWGDKGYILMQRGINLCNIETWPAYVVPV